MKRNIEELGASISVTRKGAGIYESSADSREEILVICSVSEAPWLGMRVRSTSHCAVGYLFSERWPHFKEGM